MKLALIQCDVDEGRLVENANKIASFCNQCRDADLCLVSSGTLAGPKNGCARQTDYEAALFALARSINGSVILLCSLPGCGNMLVTHGAAKPVPDILELGGARIGINPPLEMPDCLDVNIYNGARPFSPGVQEDWELILSGAARDSGAFAVSVNLVGGYDNVIYNGQSVAMDATGQLAGRAGAFSEDMLLVDTKNWKTNRIEPVCASIQEAQWLALNLGLADFFRKNQAREAILGLSGGMDSALVGCIAVSALGAQNVTGVIMPSRYTSAESLRDACELADNLGMKTITVPVEPLLEAMRTTLGPGLELLTEQKGNVAAENMQARIRGLILMTFANWNGALVLNTGNKSESAMGYCTLYGDAVGAIGVIGDLFKTEVYALARWYCEREHKMVIPQNIFDKEPSAELKPGQKDTDSLPPYNELDPRLEKLLKGELPADDPLCARVRGAGFKRRQSPPPLLVSGLPLARLC